MMALPFDNKGFFLSILIALSLIVSGPSKAENPNTVVDWGDLLPANLYSFIPETGITSQMWLDEDFQQKLKDSERITRPELEGARVVLPGYMVPLDYEGDAVKSFLLVPNAGQCIHVPPPPPNQTIIVHFAKTTPMRTYSDPIIVRGLVRVVAGQTDYAETGYEIQAQDIVEFDFDRLETMVNDLGERD